MNSYYANFEVYTVFLATIDFVTPTYSKFTPSHLKEIAQCSVSGEIVLQEK